MGMDDEEDATVYLEAAGFDFDVVEYAAPTEVDPLELANQLDALQQSAQEACSTSECCFSSPDAAPDAVLRLHDESSGPCSVLVVAFAALGGGGGGVARHEFVSACRRCGAKHAMFLKDTQQSWYLFGLGADADGDAKVASPATGFDDVVSVIQTEISQLRPQRVVVLGASMGGYAAIRAGLALRASTVLAFGPQVFIDASERELLALSPMEFDPDLRRVQAREPSVCLAWCVVSM